MPHRHAAPGRPRRHAASPPARRADRRTPLTVARRLTLAAFTVALLGVTLALPAISDTGEATSPETSSSAAAAVHSKRAHHGAHGKRASGRASASVSRTQARSAKPSPRTSAPSVTAGSTPSSSPSAQATAGTGTAPVTTGTDRTAAGNGPFLPYTADSFFRRQLPDVTPISPENARLVAFARSANPDPYLKIRGAHGVGWGIAYAEADCSDPVYRIGSGTLPASQAHLRDVGFHAPASVWQDIPPNADAPFLVVDRCGTSARPGGLSVWGAGTKVSGSTVTVAYGGSFSHDSNGLDRRNPLSNSQLNERSRGVIPDSMLVRLDALDHAIRADTGLGYVLEVFWVETDSSAGVGHPMVGAESGKSGAGAEGQRFRIKPGVDLASRPGCGPVGLAIARTLQQHGAYIGDNSGSGSGIKTEQNANYPGLDADSLRGCMTWDDIEFLPLGWDG
jgi:hypothetical protein